MPRIVFVFCLLIAALTVRADYRIVALNTPTITIDGRTMKVNDTFRPSAQITWSTPTQAMKVLDTSTGRQRLIVAPQYKKSKAKNAREYLAGKKNLTTRSEPPRRLSASNPRRGNGRLMPTGAPAQGGTEALKRLLDDKFYLVDSLTVETDFPTDASRYFSVEYKYKGRDVSKKLGCKDGTFAITRSAIEAAVSDELPLKLYYIDRTKGGKTLITDRMRVVLLPPFVR